MDTLDVDDRHGLRGAVPEVLGWCAPLDAQTSVLKVKEKEGLARAQVTERSFQQFDDWHPVTKPRDSRSLQPPFANSKGSCLCRRWLPQSRRGIATPVSVPATFRFVRAGRCRGFRHHPLKKIAFLSCEFVAVLLLMQETALLLPNEV